VNTADLSREGRGDQSVCRAATTRSTRIAQSTSSVDPAPSGVPPGPRSFVGFENWLPADGWPVQDQGLAPARVGPAGVVSIVALGVGLEEQVAGTVEIAAFERFEPSVERGDERPIVAVRRLERLVDHDRHHAALDADPAPPPPDEFPAARTEVEC